MQLRPFPAMVAAVVAVVAAVVATAAVMVTVVVPVAAVVAVPGAAAVFARFGGAAVRKVAAHCSALEPQEGAPRS